MAKIIPNEEKVFMVSKSTNTAYSGSAALKAMQEWYTMEDVANTVKPYKVFNALLAQGGGDNPLIINGDEAIPLTIGVTYAILDNTGLDVTNVGAPNNNIGTSFVATGTTPNSWGNVIDGWAIISYNTGAPVVVVLENTLGFNPFFVYSAPGFYFSSNLEWVGFVLNGLPVQVFINCGNRVTDYIYSAKANFGTEDGTLSVSSFNEGTPANDVLCDEDGFFLTSIEVRVYN